MKNRFVSRTSWIFDVTIPVYAEVGRRVAYES